MWRACIDVVAHWAPQAVHVLDRFHIVKRLNEAVDQIRRAESKALGKVGSRPLKNTRWCLLKRLEKLVPSQLDKLVHLLSYDLRTVRAYNPGEADLVVVDPKNPATVTNHLIALAERAK